MRKSFAVIFIIVFAVVISVQAFAEENYPIQSIKGKLMHVKVDIPGSGRAIGNTLVFFEEDGRDFDGMNPILKCFEGELIEIFHQYSEKNGARGHVIKYVIVYMRD